MKKSEITEAFRRCASREPTLRMPVAGESNRPIAEPRSPAKPPEAPKAGQDSRTVLGGQIQPNPMNIELLYATYLKTRSLHRAALEFGTNGETARRHLLRAGKKLIRSSWSAEDDQFLLDTKETKTAKAVAQEMGRTVESVYLRRSRLERGVATPNKKAKTKACETCGSDFLSFGTEKHCSVSCYSNGPVALAGLLRSADNRRLTFPVLACTTCGKEFTPTSRTPTKTHCSISCAQRDYEVAKRRITTTRANPFASKTGWTTCKRGWLEIGGQRVFFRSKWEMNYARWLEFLKSRGEILSWEHEPETFWFEKIKRGVRSYLPDFRVTLIGGGIEYHEVKGWMDAKSKTKIKRMAKYYPKTVLVVRDSVWFRRESKVLRNIVPGWDK